MANMEGLNLSPVEYWLALWHEHRTAIVLGAFFSLLILRTYLHLSTAREEFSQSRFLVSPPLLRSLEEKTASTSTNGDVKRGTSALHSTSSQPDRIERRQSPKRVVGQKLKRPRSSDSPASAPIRVLVFYASIGGTTERAATLFHKTLCDSLSTSDESARFLIPRLHDLSDIDYEDYFTAPPDEGPHARHFYLLLLPSYDIDTLLDTFVEHLSETHNDFRINTSPLASILGYSVFGFGDRQEWPTEADGFCSQAREVDKWMAKLTGRKRAFPLGMGDAKIDARQRLQEWSLGVLDVLQEMVDGNGLGEGIAGSGDAIESDEEDDVEDEDSSATPAQSKSANVDDLEDLGRTVRTTPDEDQSASAGPLPIDFTTYGKSTSMPPPTGKEMVPRSSPTYTALTKQGYTIVGSHSGVKICRWTKSALRGRGSCYKYSFYGIASHLCMETTPSLSCSNKCVFCWRHGTNPVGTTWRWKVDPPELIFAGVKAAHYQKIKMLKGVPGVRADRFAEAFRIRHCALSLVGEPIFYPHIDEFTALLHAEHISSFLVCNAQHPDQLAALKPVTQLYVSIDASNRDSLKKIDRPLHRDFWERLQRCLSILREKRNSQRTVFRLTLVKNFNIADEIDGYADMVEKALPGFVEIKGVTFCGTSTSASAGLRMENVPYYEEVSAFAVSLNRELERRGLEYGIAAEHAHSCCILLASKRFLVDGSWHTRIDYARFFELLESGRPFSPEEYMDREPTPEWATWGQGGFDPRDVRVKAKGRNKTRFVDGVPAVEEA